MSEDKRIAADLVLRDLERAKRDAKAAEPNAIFHNTDDPWPVLPDGGAGTFIPMSLGSRLDLSHEAVAVGVKDWHRVRAQYPNAMFYINLLGFDEDPREIWHIKPAAKFFRRWAHAVGITTPEIAEQQGLVFKSIQTLATVGAFGEEIRARIKVPPVPQRSERRDDGHHPEAVNVRRKSTVRSR